MHNDFSLLWDASKAGEAEVYEVQSTAYFIKDGEVWKPLEDDGDAFRLAVKKCIFTVHHDLFLRFFNEEIKLDKKPTEATRLAIVRAVGELNGPPVGPNL